ncbi:MAG: DUF58 domain-containing protein [Deltaproteobacteria bacterium]|nr:DUF58 domain-containing protein [Deltaproteobacteria bacterium]
MPNPGSAVPHPAPDQHLGLLAPVDLAKLASLAVRARTIVEGALAGAHRNLHPGTSLEFTEHKEYAPGDDVRRIDWKAVARTDRYSIKRFEDETELRMLLVLDTSASMGYRRSSVSKLEYATYLAAALAYLVGQQRDAAGLFAFDSEPRAVLPPSTRPGQVREVLAALEGLRPAGRANPGRALERAAELCDKRGLIVLFSDLLDMEDEVVGETAAGPLAERLRQLRGRGHDVSLFHVLDADEVDLPFEDLTFFEGMEPDDKRSLLAEPHDLAPAFREESALFRRRWQTLAREARMEYRFARTDTPPVEILAPYLAERAGSV